MLSPATCNWSVAPSIAKAQRMATLSSESADVLSTNPAAVDEKMYGRCALIKETETGCV